MDLQKVYISTIIGNDNVHQDSFDVVKRRDLTVEEYLSNEQTGKELILNIQVPLDNKVIHMDQYIATNSVLSRPLKV